MYVEIYSFCVWDLDGMIDTWRLSAENGWKSWTGIVYCRCLLTAGTEPSGEQQTSTLLGCCLRIRIGRIHGGHRVH